MPTPYLSETEAPERASGRASGRSFRVTQWPTLIFLRDGQELARLVRPASAQDILTVMSKA